MTADDIAAHARALLDANGFLTLGTVDPDGRPWTSPVYFAADGLREFYWSSRTDAVHSRNLTERPDVSIVVFDSSVRPYHGRTLYAAGDGPRAVDPSHRGAYGCRARCAAGAAASWPALARSGAVEQRDDPLEIVVADRYLQDHQQVGMLDRA
jgi:hypothetical protein